MLGLAIKNKLLKQDIKELCKENKELYRENKEIRFEKEELSDELKRTINFLNDSIKDLLNLQDINELGLAEKEKNQHRNIIINRLVKLCINKSKELTSTVESNS